MEPELPEVAAMRDAAQALEEALDMVGRRAEKLIETIAPATSALITENARLRSELRQAQPST